MNSPTRAEVYGSRDRRTDRRRGRRDGKRRIPAYNDAHAMVTREGAVTAPYPRHLQSIALDDMAEQLADFVRRTKPRLEDLEVLRGQYADTAGDLDRATDDATAAEIPLTEEELLPRSRAEARPDQAVVLRSRREAARARRIAAAHGGEAAMRDRLGELGGRIAAAEQAIRSDFVLAQTRAKQISARSAMRVSAYWEHLVLAHAEGAYLAPMIRYTGQVLPSWVFEPATGEPKTLGQGDYELLHVVERLHPSGREPETRHDPGTGPGEYEESA
ncbi:hypothetical protein L6E12_05330 [Actinokineospora sp. PR83]|uniref:hypothetical protein n=1 Tax=Actinokineospora sp. PR83 TaxID=2884908 RepID=UPI001F420348|nr:hypothetical protein [Actinokineospora sp. PR83]MCG8915211.1 hypothetical protein [Actinokineospora sp. PR83]